MGDTTRAWTPAELGRIGVADELEIAVRRLDGTLRRWLPIWVVAVDGQVYVRSWYRRGTGWFGQVLESGAASVRVPGLQVDVTVEDVGAGPGRLREDVDEAYQVKYGRYGAGTVAAMVSAEAAATTLRLQPA
ncbi:DUF2255 family protein [Actinoplanes sp. NPDC049596]|uniref:DUF2255 family protein n=1 Tax=unclassified Actinoplanes TaxID=2626549 RepID=UPI00341381A2